MPRKGSRKARSGCLTCRARKVKCDEDKPTCQKCLSVGRKCQGLGYSHAEPACSQLHLYRPHNLVLGNNISSESRAIEFFCQVAAPSMSGPIDPYFWTHVVLQFCEFEPAVRHSVMTISSLYENLQSKDSTSLVKTQRNMLALKHYNAAIRELRTPHEPDILLTLLACLMFVCIEVIQSNGAMAIQHCQHGINLLSTSNPPQWALHHLLPIFRRLSVYPFYFGNSQPLGKPGALTIPSSFSSVSEAQASMDTISNMTIQHFRQTVDYRIGDMRSKPIPPHVLREQKQVQDYLNQWRSAFDKFEHTTRPDLVQRSPTSRIWLSHMYEICTIFSHLGFSTNESDYDKYIPNFKRIVKSARELAGLRARSTPPKFCFEMGFAHYLFLTAIKCRHLETRLEALRLMGVLCAARESLWDNGTLQIVAQRTINLEHGMMRQATGGFKTQYDSLPPDEMRVRHFVIGRAESGPGGLPCREVTFYLSKKDGGLYRRRERFPAHNTPEDGPGVFEVDLQMDELSMSETMSVSSRVVGLE
ncbi:putative transcriptional regulatory protein C15D4.02 [Fusarium austroafricanum]|uniref:Putative transcriptional regulatory protein C15D4.02 n=1 Tax=Fusarium austroafricanum TaxID=2364996 RepID=A0A8H4KU30_9HYPO|nr:putative transcriptional regulatory protein C15D4.02 [Fusarium austroafricanum]